MTFALRDRCSRCGEPFGDHRAKTFACPGRGSSDRVSTFRPKGYTKIDARNPVKGWRRTTVREALKATRAANKRRLNP
jgi:hypothetical protein